MTSGENDVVDIAERRHAVIARLVDLYRRAKNSDDGRRVQRQRLAIGERREN